MTAPVLQPTNAPVSKTAARWRLAVDGDYDPNASGSAATTSTAAAWLQVFGITDFSPGTVDYTEQDDTDYDSVDASGLVWASSTTTGAAWTISGTVKLADYGGARDPGAGKLEDASDGHVQVHVMWFDRFGTKCYHGYGFVKFTVQGGSPTDVSTAQFEIKGQGVRRVDLPNPVAGSAIPNAVSASPTSGAAGTMITVTGTGFVGVVPTTGVQFGTTDAALFIVDSPTQIRAVVPTGGTAGSQPIKVTNGAGPDPSPLAFTKS